MSNEQTSTPEVSSESQSTTQPTTQPNTEQQAPPPQISLQHLTNLLNIVDLSSQRGAFRATELEGIGSTYNTIKRFIEYQQQLIQESQESQN